MSHHSQNKNFALKLVDLEQSIIAWKKIQVKADTVVVEFVKSYRLPWTKLVDKHKPSFSRMKEEEVETPNEDPMAKIMDMMKLLYNKGGSDMKQDIEKAWLKAEKKYGEK